jgi:transposase-like protein
LTAILGERASGLSATNVVRLKAGWEEEYKAWCQRDLSAKAYVYWWADGIYFNVRLDEERSCVLVLMGALADGTKELLAIVDGYRESTQYSILAGTASATEASRVKGRAQTGHW